MEDLKLLIEMVAKLPNTALWVLAGYLVYKLAVIGSWFGLARFFIDKLHSWLTKQNVDVRLLLDGQTVTGTKDALLTQLERVRLQGYTGGYIHQSHIDWLREAIDDKIAKDQKK